MKLLLRIVVSFIFCLLVACSTPRPTQEETDKIKIAEINIRLGMAYLENKDYERAKSKLLMAQEQAPKLPESWYTMGYLLESTGNKNAANEYYLKAIALAPKRGDVQNNYGTYLCRLGQYSKSIEHFQIAAQDRSYLAPASAYENAGLCALKIPDRTLAQQFFKMALAEDPNRIVSINELAKLNPRPSNGNERPTESLR